MNNLDQLNYPTVTGLKSLELDELSATNFTASTIDGDIIFYNRIEGNEVIVDTKLTLTSTGVIAVGDKFISDIELTYLDGVSSNIQQQITNINNTNTTAITALQTSDNSQNLILSTHTGQITALQTSDTSQNTLLGTHTSQITALQTSDTSQNLILSTHTTQITALQISDTSQNTAIASIQSVNTTQNINITALQTSDTSQNINITNLQTSDTSQNTAITTLQTKTQNITSADAASTNMSKPIIINYNGECFKMLGTHSFFSGYDTIGTTRYFAIGKESPTSNRLIITNSLLGEVVIQSGGRTGNTNWGQNKIITHSNGIQLKRGGISPLDIIEVNVGEIGATNTADANLYINGNGTNNILIDSGLGSITMSAVGGINTISTGLILSRTLNNIYYSGGVIGLTNAGNNTFYINGNGTNDIYMSSGSGIMTLYTSSSISLNSNVIWVGSGAAAGNGRKSNINMLDATGNNWETQSSAFTETLKQQVLSSVSSTRLDAARDFTVGVGINTGFNAIGRTNLANSTAYGTGSTLLDVGALLNASYPTLFDAGGSYIGASPARYELLFYNEYLCLNSTVRQCRSRIRVYTSAGVNSGSFLDNSGFGGIDYTANSALHNLIAYNTSPFKFDFTTGQKIRVETVWMATTSSLGTANTMLGRFYMHRIIY